MKNDFRRLKGKIFLQVIAACALTFIIGYLILTFLVDSALQDPFANAFLFFCRKIFQLDKETAIVIYQKLFRENKAFLVSLGFVILLLIFIYFAMSRFTRYFNKIVNSVDMLVNESDEKISLPPELAFMESKLNTVKGTLQKRKIAALESEQRKNDLVVYLAHDIKTPLTSVIGYLSLLEEASDMPLEQRAKYTKITLDKA
ncbi:MAG: histidine kinase dimerization/phospho-acceptor domain-containing protein, partial [Ruminiclostridium sp.]